MLSVFASIRFASGDDPGHLAVFLQCNYIVVCIKVTSTALIQADPHGYKMAITTQ